MCQQKGQIMEQCGFNRMGWRELQKASRDNSFQKFYSKTKQKNRTVAGGGGGSKMERKAACVNVQKKNPIESREWRWGVERSSRRGIWR